MLAAADITLLLVGTDGVVGVPGGPSAFRFFESFDTGLMSWADRVSVVE